MKQLFKFLLLALIFNFQSSIFNDLSAQTLRDRYNSQIGRVERDGTVRDRYNSHIGKAEGVDARIAAVLFFMNLLNLK